MTSVYDQDQDKTEIEIEEHEAAGRADVVPVALSEMIASSEETWEMVPTDIGTKIEWELGRVFVGHYLGSVTVSIDPTKSIQGNDEVQALCFVDLAGEHWFAFETPRLRTAFSQIAEGQKVAIEWLGKEEIDGGRKLLNNFRVAVARG